MKQKNEDYLKFLENKGKLTSALESLRDCYEKLDLIEELFNTIDFQGEIGSELVCLMGRITENDKYIILPHSDQRTVRFGDLIKKHFPEGHAVHKYIEVFESPKQVKRRGPKRLP